MNDEIEIDLIELVKYVLKNIKKILIAMLTCGLITFIVSQFILPKSYVSSTSITITPQGELQDYTSYLSGNDVLEKVSSKLPIDAGTLMQSVIVTKDESNPYNYSITATTNNAKLSYRIVNTIVKSFKSEMKNELNLNSVTIINPAQINYTPVSPNVKNNTKNAIILGFLFSGAYFVFTFLFNTHFRNAKDVERYLGVDVLTEIPREK
ncbi:YveK family protein [Holdemanella porci]|uniref:YveK family protein n=1 Tax=Holdemanella porci TaxID=2652276 RepID=UPI003F93641F